MFGYVTADLPKLSEEQRERYRGCYCGLCRRLGRLGGLRSRMTLTYDMTFLILVLNSLYPEEEHTHTGRCLMHPRHKRTSWYSAWTDYGAALNLVLTYYKLLDDWQDDRSRKARIAAWLLRGPVRRISGKYPEQCASIRRELACLSGLEKANICDPDRTSASFGRLMAALFVPRPEDGHAQALNTLGQALGSFIYLMDARLDLKDDLLNEHFNPLISLPNPDMEPVLTMLLAPGTAAAEKLPLQKDRELIFNILYSGVWIKYRIWNQEREEERHV